MTSVDLYRDVPSRESPVEFRAHAWEHYDPEADETVEYVELSDTAVALLGAVFWAFAGMLTGAWLAL